MLMKQQAVSVYIVMLLAAAFINQAVSATPQTIRPGALWPDNRGRHIQAHGGGILKVGSTYYWFGEDRSRDNDPGKRYVSLLCLPGSGALDVPQSGPASSPDPENLGPRLDSGAAQSLLQRPHQAVCHVYAHRQCSYQLARVGVAVCDRQWTADYQYLRSFRPLGHESRDIGQFVDDDGVAYLIFEDRPFGFRIARLSPDYLTLDREVCLSRCTWRAGRWSITRAFTMCLAQA